MPYIEAQSGGKSADIPHPDIDEYFSLSSTGTKSYTFTSTPKLIDIFVVFRVQNSGSSSYMYYTYSYVGDVNGCARVQWYSSSNTSNWISSNEYIPWSDSSFFTVSSSGMTITNSARTRWFVVKVWY